MPALKSFLEMEREEGIEQGRIEVARNLLAEGTDPKFVSKARGWPLKK